MKRPMTAKSDITDRLEVRVAEHYEAICPFCSHTNYIPLPMMFGVEWDVCSHCIGLFMTIDRDDDYDLILDEYHYLFGGRKLFSYFKGVDVLDLPHALHKLCCAWHEIINRKPGDVAQADQTNQVIQTAIQKYDWATVLEDVLVDAKETCPDSDYLYGEVIGRWAYDKVERMYRGLPAVASKEATTRLKLHHANVCFTKDMDDVKAEVLRIFNRWITEIDAVTEQLQWRIYLNLDTPNLVPPVVQYAIFDEDPLPGFRARIKKMQTYLQEQLEQAENNAKKELARSSFMSVNWDWGIKQVTGDKLNLLKSAISNSHCVSSNSPVGKKWIVTKIVRIKGKPVCWCMTAEVKMGEQTEVIFTEDNVFGLEDVLDAVMRDPDEGE
jgi:hypothetical protein